MKSRMLLCFVSVVGLMLGAQSALAAGAAVRYSPCLDACSRIAFVHKMCTL